MCFEDRFYLRRLLRCFLGLSHNELNKVLRLIFFKYFLSRFPDLFPSSIWNLSSVIFAFFQFFPIISVEILQALGWLREMISEIESTVSDFPGVSSRRLISLFLYLV